MICVLKVVEGPAKGMKCWLRTDQRLTIGRQSNCDFSIPTDAHMSRNHMIVEGLESSFRIRDVGSSNGTYVNDFAITSIELCNGDRIKVGSSVFEVDLEDLQEAPTEVAALPEREEIPGFVPNRTLTVDMLTHDQEITMRYSLDSLLELPLPGNAERLAEAKGKARSTSDVDPQDDDGNDEVVNGQTVSVDPTASSQPKAADSLTDSTASSTSIPSRFLAGFTQTEGKLLWRQTADAAMWEPLRLIDCLMASEWESHLSLIVNRSQVDAAQSGTLDFAISAGHSRPLTETLYLLHSTRPSEILEFYKRCLTKDAAVCIASFGPLSNHWLHEAIDALSYPSMLFELLDRSPERARQLARKVHFIMFEPNTQGELCLLRSAP
ncbi:MAG: FHA domain-containing protein [Pirellulaceae bacterium]